MAPRRLNHHLGEAILWSLLFLIFLIAAVPALIKFLINGLRGKRAHPGRLTLPEDSHENARERA